MAAWLVAVGCRAGGFLGVQGPAQLLKLTEVETSSGGSDGTWWMPQFDQPGSQICIAQ